MTTFKQFILEGNNIVKPWESQELDAKEAIKLMNSKARSGLLAIANGGLLFRGFGKSPGKSNSIVKMDSSTGERTSRDTDNLYQLMMNESSKMKDYPSRSKSFICITDYEEAINYGRLYVMVPFDGTKVAVSNKSDLFAQNIKTPLYNGTVQDISLDFSLFLSAAVGNNVKTFNDAALLNTALSKFSPEELLLMYDACNFDQAVKFKNPDHQKKYKLFAASAGKSKMASNVKLMNQLKELSTIAKKTGALDITGAADELYKLMKKCNPSSRFAAIASTICTPENLRLSLNNFGSPLPQGVECWFSGPCFAIPALLFSKMLMQIQKEKIVKLHPRVESFLEDYED